MELINKYINQLPSIENMDSVFVNILSDYLKDVDLGLLSVSEAVDCAQESYLEIEPFI